MYQRVARYIFEFWLDVGYDYLGEHNLLPSCFQLLPSCLQAASNAKKSHPSELTGHNNQKKQQQTRTTTRPTRDNPEL
jgi:hypothetical protein